MIALQGVDPNPQVTRDGYHKIDWKLPSFVQHQKYVSNRSVHDQLYLTTSGQWQNGKLNGSQCKIHLSSLVDSPDGGHIMKMRNDLPQLVGTFKDSIIEKGTIKLNKQWKFAFDSIRLSPLFMTENYNNIRDATAAQLISSFEYCRFFIFTNAIWTSHCNKLKCNGSFITSLKYVTLAYKHLNVDQLGNRKVIIKCCGFSLLYLDLLFSFIKCNEKCEIFKGTIEYNFSNCNVSYKATMDENLTIGRFSYHMHRRDNKLLKWKIGCVDSDLESQKTIQVLNESLQRISIRSYPEPPIKLTITFNYNSTIDDTDDNHQHGKETECFLNVENQCPFKQFSFIPDNGEKLINFLKNKEIIEKVSHDFGNNESLSVVFTGDAKLRRNICRCVQFLMSGKCKIQAVVNLNNNKQDKQISVLLYEGDYYRNKLSAASIMGKISNGNSNRILYNEIQQLKELGFEFGRDNVDLSIIFDKIRHVGINTVCDCLKYVLGMKKCDLNDLKSWLKNRDSTRRQWSLTQIEWEKLYQTRLVDLIEHVLSCKRQRENSNGILEVKWWIINDTQNWNMLHYGAYFNDCKLIEIGQQYILDAGRILTSRKISSYPRTRREFLVKTNNFCTSPDSFGNTPLHVASQYGNVESLIKLINFQCDSKCFKEAIKDKLVTKNHDGLTPLKLALRYDNIECVKVLFKEFKFISDTNKLISTDFGGGDSVFILLAAS